MCSCANCLETELHRLSSVREDVYTMLRQTHEVLFAVSLHAVEMQQQSGCVVHAQCLAHGESCYDGAVLSLCYLERRRSVVVRE